MTDPRDAAIERVMAYVDAHPGRSDRWGVADTYTRENEHCPLLLGDLRLLLTDPRQPSEPEQKDQS